LNKEAKDIPPQQQIQAGVTEGVVRYVGRTDGVDRIFAFHSISYSPFYVLVGRAIGEQFAGWYKVAAISSALTFAGILLLGLFLYRLKKSELKFRQSEIQYQAVVESQLDAVCRWLPDTTLTFANAKYKELFAPDNETLIGHRWVEFGLPDERETILSTFSRLEEHPKPFSTENSVTSRDGSTRDFHWITVPLLDEKGKCIEFQSVGRDITELKQAEVALRESEARIRAITDTAMDAILMMDPSGRVAYWNPAAERIFGYTKDEAMGMNLHGLIAPLRYHESYKKAFVEFQKTGQGNAINTTLEMEACHKDGHEISIELSLTALHFREGWLSTGIIRDITNRKQAEVALRESEERFKTLHDASFGGIFIHDQGIILDCNQGLSELTGYTFEELVGMDGFMLFAPDWRELVMENIQSGFEQLYEVEALRKDGTIYPLSIRGKVIPYKGRTVRVTEFRDITERKQAEEERKSLQMQLIQAQKMEAIGTLAGGIAHDFNNILGAILGYTEIACDDIPPESNAIKHLGKVLEASHRASSLVKQILVFSRQADAEHVALQPAVIIKEAIKLLRPSLPSTITIKQQIDHATKPIFADPTQVHQILMNLCTNAFHAMEQTGGTLEIVLKNCELSQNDLKDHPGLDSGNFVALSVRDTGPGIEEKIREKIFEPYFTTKEMGKGTGMGLAIVHGIVNSYGGYITCESEVGKGTVFNILFPAIDEEIVTELNPIETVPTGNERILYIDDEKMLADLGKAMLTRLGYEVTVQTSSLDALDMFRNHPEQFDAVITDQTMPGMTGINLARELLQIRPDIPIVICTGYSNLITKEQVIAEGIGGFILKPLNREKIATLLRKVLDSDKLPGQSPFQA
jgi:PAS domain S-box-containing protein